MNEAEKNFKVQKLKKLTPFFEGLFPKGRPQGELWAHWISHAEILRWLLFVCIIAVLFLSITVVIVSRKPPVVVRVDEIGNARVIQDLETNNTPADVEITAYAKEFLRAYLELNSLTVQKDLTRALNMMTKKYQQAHLRELQAEGFLKKIINANIQTQIEIRDISITSKMPARVYLDVRGITSTTPLEDPHATATKHGFLSKLTLVLVPRTELTPNGLLVEDYRQEIIPLEELMGPQKVLPAAEKKEEAE